jgi:site-specific recombinase XerD
MTGTELKIIAPAATEVLGPDVDRLATLHTNARTDGELLKVWLKSHQDGSAHTVRVYHRVGFTRFNAAPLIKLKKAPRQVAQRIMGELDVRTLIRAAKLGRDQLMLDVAYFGGLRVSELVSLIWGQVIRRDSGEAQLEIVGKGDKVRQVLIPVEIAARLLASRGDAPASAPVFGSVRRPGQALTERAVNYMVKAAAKRAGVNPAVSVHWLRHAHASHAIDNGAPITLVSATLGHADLKTTSVYAHARPGESSGRYLKTK